MSLRFEQDGRVRRITLAAPARRNTIDQALAREFLAELAHAASDPATGAILLDAEGPVFCAGADSLPDLPDDFFTFGRLLEKPIVVAVHGVAVSAGLALIANAHVAVAAQGSSFGLTDIREGRSHAGLLDAVARALGQRRTVELALTGRIFSTPEALAWGLVHSVAPAFELDDRATAAATALANASAEAVKNLLAPCRESSQLQPLRRNANFLG
jgi:enoyl-CoA hydratase/carnithine racemase